MEQVSIHAPARGATFLDGVIGWEAGVSIHAPARARPGFEARKLPLLGFNPRARAGRDKSCSIWD
jgi:hypothetical protein